MQSSAVAVRRAKDDTASATQATTIPVSTLHARPAPSSAGSPVDAVLLANPVVAGADAAVSTTGHHGVPQAAAADAPIDHLARLVHRDHDAAGPFGSAWPITLLGGALLALLALVVADVGVRRQHAA